MRAYWSTFDKCIRHNRNIVAGFNWNADPTGKDFYSLRANLIHDTILAVLSNVYSRNPEISTTPTYLVRTSTLVAPLASACNPMDRITARLGNMGI